MIGKELDTYIKNKVKEILDKNKFPDYDNVYTDTFSELIDKLIIVYIRYWYLEDSMANAKNDEELLIYRKKSESLFKEKRPMLVEGLDKLIFKLLKGDIDYTPINTKKYDKWGDEKDDNTPIHLLSQKSLEKEWLSDEDDKSWKSL